MLDILVILDRSGSMEKAQADHEGGLKSFVHDQQQLPGEVMFTLVQFDDHDPCEIVYDRVPIDKVGQIRLIPRDGTPLLDAIGLALAHLEKKQVTIVPDTVVMIITDGEENSSTEWTKALVKERIAARTKDGWRFLFLGANVDAFSEASAFGLSATHALNFQNKSGNVQSVYAMSSSKLSSSRGLRAAGSVIPMSDMTAMNYTAEDQAVAMADDPFKAEANPFTGKDPNASDSK